jgi:hypothetical protein
MGNETAGGIKVKVPWALDDPNNGPPAVPVWGGLDAVNRQYILNLVSASGVYIGPDPPPDPRQGQLWYRNDPDGDLYIYYDDAGNNIWVSATNTAGSPPIPGAPPLIGDPALIVPVNFPTNPVMGEQFTAQNGNTYIWDGIVWMQAGTGGLVFIGVNPPLNPLAGQLWWRNDPDGQLFIYYDDGSSQQWVQAVPTGGGGGGGGGIADAPIDGVLYGRQNQIWTPILPGTGGGVDQAYVDQQDALRVLKAGDTITGPLTLADMTGSTYLELVGSAQNSIAFRGSGPASGSPQWVIDVITGQTPVMNGFHLARLSPDGLTVIDDVFNILNSDGIIRAGIIRTKSGDPVDPDDLARKAYIDAADALRVLKAGDTMTGNLRVTNPAESGLTTFIELRNPTGNPTIELSTTAVGAASNIIFSYGGTGWGLSVEQNVFHIYHQTAPGNAVNPLTINNDNTITMNSSLILDEPISGVTALQLIGSFLNHITLGPLNNPAIPQWYISVDSGSGPLIQGFHLMRMNSDGTQLDQPITILNSDGIIRANQIRTNAGDPVDPNDLARKAYIDSRIPPPVGAWNIPTAAAGIDIATVRWRMEGNLVRWDGFINTHITIGDKNSLGIIIFASGCPNISVIGDKSFVVSIVTEGDPSLTKEVGTLLFANDLALLNVNLDTELTGDHTVFLDGITYLTG